MDLQPYAKKILLIFYAFKYSANSNAGGHYVVHEYKIKNELLMITAQHLL